MRAHASDRCRRVRGNVLFVQLFSYIPYIAGQELEEKHSKNAALRSDENSKVQLATLRRVKDKEVEMNKKTMQDKVGQTISFGEVVQLLHLSSQKYLTVSRTDVAKVEPENFQVELAKDVSSLAWFTLKPSAAFHAEYDPVVCLE